MKLKPIAVILSLTAVLWHSSARAGAITDAEAEQIADDLLGRMTLAEKVGMLHGNALYGCAGVPRLGIPPFHETDGPCSIRPEFGEGAMDGRYLYGGKATDCATALPPLSAVAATWDPAMARLFGETLSSEARARGKDMCLGPAINIMRTPVCGRTFEYMGEDPFLTAHMCVPVIQGIQSNDVAACVKHYAMNNQELDRGSVNVTVDERTMREIYLPGFQAAIQQGPSLGIMGAYNKVGGLWCCENPLLLKTILRDEWGFKGLVISDWGAVHDMKRAALAGCDQESGHASNFPRLAAAVQKGELPESAIDDKVRRVLFMFAKIRKIGPESALRVKGEINTPAHQAAARKIATEAIVLLKNDGNVLPLDSRSLKRVLVVGRNATTRLCLGINTTGGCDLNLAGGSGEAKPPYEVTALDGLRKRLGDGVKIDYVSPDSGTFSDIKPAGSNGAPADWDAAFFNNRDLQGEPILKRNDAALNFDWQGRSPAPGVPGENFSARWKTRIVAPETGVYRFRMGNDDGARFFIDGKPVLTAWRVGGLAPITGTASLEGGREYEFAVEYFQAAGPSTLTLQWQLPSDPGNFYGTTFAQQARQADAVLLFTGDTHADEQEGKDRPNIKLAAGQDAMVDALAGLNPRTVVINQSGAPVEMPWAEKVKSIVQYWFSGQEGGNALAAILCGDANPSGRLPCTFPKNLEDEPSMRNYSVNQVNYAEGLMVGYRAFDTKNIAPLFPFGHGLSYTTFKYGPVRLSSNMLTRGGSITVSVSVTNTGSRAGAEVVQVYVHDTHPLIERPVQELKGFARIELQPGETKTVNLPLTPRDFTYWSVQDHGWKANPGVYEVRAGASSRDIRGAARVLLSNL